MGEAIVITSGKGGAGKTTLSANIGVALALLGHKTLLIDTDIGLRNLDIVLGLEDRIVYDLVDACNGMCDLKKAIIKDKRFEGLYLLPASQAKEKDAITPLQMKVVVTKAKEEFEYIIIDSPAGIEQGFENAVSGADSALVVALPEAASVRDADRIIGLLENHGIKDVKLVVNRIRQNLVDRGSMISIEEMLETLAVDLAGAVPDDESIIVAANAGIPCVSDVKSKAGTAYKNIARRLTGESVELMNMSKKNIFSRIVNILK